MTASSSGLGSLPISLVWVNAGRTAVEIVSVVDGRRDLATEG